MFLGVESPINQVRLLHLHTHILWLIYLIGELMFIVLKISGQKILYLQLLMG